VLGVATAAGVGLTGRLLLAIAAVGAYVPLAGGGPSIQRAGVMGGAALLAMLVGRPSSRWYALLLAAGATLTLNPYALGDVGWQLSFAAVVSLLAIGPRLALSLRRVAPRPVAEALALTLAATGGTAPLVALHFGRLSAVSVGANLLAAPVVAPVMWLGAIAAAVGQASPALAWFPAWLAGPPLGYLGWLARTAARMPGAEASVALTPVGAAAVYAASLGAVVGARGRWAPRLRRTTRRTKVAAALAAVLVLGVGAARARGPGPPDGLVVSFLDIGQGDATLIQHGGATALVDTGPPGSPLLERLRAAGVRRIDLLVVTHAQADHDGGAASVLDRLPVGLLLDGADGAPTPLHRAMVAAAARRGVRRIAPDTGQSLRAGPFELRVLWPRREPPEDHAGEDPNQRAIVAHLRVGAFDLLLPADAESDVTAALELPPVEVLKVAHHGSADPGTPDLLARLQPRVAVIEVGRGNSYGHPAPATLAALRAVPAVYRTDRDGTVRLTVRDGRMTVSRGS
jgi:competence protein ComEC